MKTAGFYKEILVILILSLFQTLSAQVCEAVIETCPEDIDGDTITVPSSVVSLSSNIYVCEPDSVLESHTSKPPSIFFIIDHSGSMTVNSHNGNPPRDVEGVRFDVTSELIDSIYNKTPDAEVGLAVFSDKLYFSEDDNNDYFGMFQTLPLPGYPDTNQGAYVPLMRLDERIQGNTTGYEALESLLTTEWTTREEKEFRDLEIKPPGREEWQWTNINSAMEAAEAAFQDSEIEPENQYIIFISDGMATMSYEGDQQVIREESSVDYVSGENLPTIFTVFFTDPGVQRAPDEIYEFVSNVSDNGYSSTNPMSNLWNIDVQYDSILDLLSRKVLSSIIQVYSSKPDSIYVNGRYSAQYNNDFFTFEDKFPLEEDSTTLNYTIYYSMVNPEKDDTIYRSADTEFYIKREKEDTALSDNISIYCWESPDLSITYNGDSVTQVRDYMDTLEVSLIPHESQYYQYPDSFEVSVYGGNGDTLNIVLFHESGDTWSAEFLRETGEADSDDAILQHNPVDSITAFYRNPEIPLDTVKTSVLFELNSNIAIVRRAFVFDNNADGYIDSIYLEIDGDYPQQEFEENIGDILDIFPERGISIEEGSLRFDSQGNPGFTVTENSTAESKTYLTESDEISVEHHTFTNGILFTGGAPITIYDRMAPVVVKGSVAYSSDSTGIDSLYVYLSEPIDPVTQREPFYFRSSDSLAEVFKLDIEYLSDSASEGGTSMVQVFRILDNQPSGFRVLNEGDSIWIDEERYISDPEDNRQDNPENRRAPITDSDFEDKSLLRVSATGVQPVPDFLLSHPDVSSELKGSTKGNIIVVSPEEGTVPGHGFFLEGKITIYDHVGNCVIRNRPMVYSHEREKLLYVWNGRNSENRKVHNYVYYCSIDITMNDNKKITKKVFVSRNSEE